MLHLDVRAWQRFLVTFLISCLILSHSRAGPMHELGSQEGLFRSVRVDADA